MNRIILTAALLAACFGAKAQGTSEKPIVSSKCFVCQKPFKYERFAHSEELTIRDTVFVLDWATREIIVDGDVFDMQQVKKEGNRLSLRWGEYYTRGLILTYDGNRCIDYKFEF